MEYIDLRWFEVWKTEGNKWITIAQDSLGCDLCYIWFSEEKESHQEKSLIESDYSKAMPFVLRTERWEWARHAETWKNNSVNSEHKKQMCYKYLK